MASKIFDMTIIGGGPVGLFAAGFAGEMGANCLLIESRFHIGGMMMAVYPDKDVYNFPGIQSVKGRELISLLREKADRFGMVTHLGEYVNGIKPANKKMVMTKTDHGEYLSSVAIIASGLKAHYSPLSDYVHIRHWDGTGIYDHWPSPESVAGKTIGIIVGTSNRLEIPSEILKVASKIVVVADSSQIQGDAGFGKFDFEMATVEILESPWTIKNIGGNFAPENLAAADTSSGKERLVAIDIAIGLFDFQTRQTLYSNLGIEMIGQQIKVDQRMQTSLRRVYAIGDIAWYPGKIMMLPEEIDEARMAVKNALKII